MKTREIGRTGMDASVIALGCWQMGGWMWGGADRKQSLRAIEAVIDAGVNFVDTAPIYGFGLSESLVGEALKGKRDEVIIASKCGMVVNTREGDLKFRSNVAKPDENGHIGIYINLSPESIRREIEASLKRLQTDYIDLYQTHWQTETAAIEDTMGTLLELKEEGKIRAIGVCNCSAETMKKYEAIGQLDSDQERYSMLDRDPETDQIGHCQSSQMAFLAYSPLAHGLLTGKFDPDYDFDDGDMRQDNPKFSKENLKRVSDLLTEIAPIAKDRHLTIPQLVLNWTASRPGVTHVLAGARKPEHAAANAVATSVDLTQTEKERIDSALLRMFKE